jgi:cephalosporin-C deacetylase
VISPTPPGPHPAVVHFVGYGGGRGLPEEHLMRAGAGFVQVVMDTRGQGAQWGAAALLPTPDMPVALDTRIHDSRH